MLFLFKSCRQIFIVWKLLIQSLNQETVCIDAIISGFPFRWGMVPIKNKMNEQLVQNNVGKWAMTQFCILLQMLQISGHCAVFTSVFVFFQYETWFPLEEVEIGPVQFHVCSFMCLLLSSFFHIHLSPRLSRRRPRTNICMFFLNAFQYTHVFEKLCFWHSLLGSASQPN